MANLIPPDAKKEVLIEYWLRVITVWFVLIGFALIAITLLKLPTFVLVQSQLNAFSGAYDEAKDKTEAYKTAQETIEDANNLATLLAKEESMTRLTEVMDALDTIAGADVSIDSFTIQRTGNDISNITISGVALTRISLANFSKDVEASPFFVKAEVPISNLAKDRDIAFTINVEPE